MRKMNPIITSLIALLLLGTSSLYPAQSAESDRYITVTGIGTVSVIPDALRLYLTLTNMSDKSAPALANVAKTATSVRSALKSEGIAAKDIKSSTLTVYPEYNYTQDKGSVQIGYRASQSFEVIVRNAASAGAVVDDVVTAAGDDVQIQGATPFVLDSAKATASARAAAVANARAKAKSYAELLDVKLGKVTYLVENSSPVSYSPIMGIAKAADSGATEIDLGNQDVTVSITIRWSLI